MIIASAEEREFVDVVARAAEEVVGGTARAQHDHRRNS